MNSIGVDLGGDKITVGMWNADETSPIGKGVEIIANDRSKRSSDTVISFKKLQYNICNQRTDKVVMNIKNFIWGFKPIIGSNDLYDDEKCKSALANDKDRAYYTIEYNNVPYKVDAETALSIIFQYLLYTCLKDKTMNYDNFPSQLSTIQNVPRNVVIGIPLYYTDSNIRGLATSLMISNLGTACFIEEHLAVALEYGYYKALHHDFSSDGEIVLFCDMGKYSTTATLVEYTNDQLTILGCNCIQLGGYTIDCAIRDMLYDHYCEKTGMTVEKTEVNMYKFYECAKKIKEELTAQGGNEVNYTISYINDEEFDDCFEKEDFETACKRNGNIFDRFYNFIFETVEKTAGEKKITTIEVVGSSMRIPKLRADLLKAVQYAGHSVSQVSNTLNMEEVCARGCCLFAQKYFEENVIACSCEDVSVVCDGEEKMTVHVFGTTSCTPKPGCFTIQGCTPIKQGVDHDYATILKEGSQFIHVFINNSIELQARHEAKEELEHCVHELKLFIDGNTTNQDFADQIEKDRNYVRDMEDFVSRDVSLYSSERYKIEKSQCQFRISQYKKSANVIQTLKQGGVEFKGFWLDSRMTGPFDCYRGKQLLFKCDYKEGVKHGKCTCYFASGKIRNIQHYDNDKLDGSFVKFYESGQCRENSTYVNGELDGYRGIFYENGQLQVEEYRENQQVLYRLCFNPRGRLSEYHVYNDQGMIETSATFNPNGQLYYRGRFKNNKFNGPSLLFYNQLFYAQVYFKEGDLIDHHQVVNPNEYTIDALDMEYAKTGTLNKQHIHWKAIRSMTVDVPELRQTMAVYNGKQQVVSSIHFVTTSDKLFNAGGDYVRNEDGGVDILTKEQKLHQSLYDANIEEAKTKWFNLFGDLLKMKIFKMGLVKSTCVKEYYLSGRNEVALNEPEKCRLRRCGFIENGNHVGHWMEYYNNGVIKREWDMVDGVQRNIKTYLNTGKEITE